MSQLLQSIKDAQLAARKNRDAVKATSLSNIISGTDRIAKDEGRDATDKDVAKVLSTFIAGLLTNIEAATKLDDKDRLHDAIVEHALLESFMPAAKPQLSEESLNLTVRKLIAIHVAEGAKPKMGVVMADLKKAHDGTYDPKQASAMVKAELDAMPEPSK